MKSVRRKNNKDNDINKKKKKTLSIIVLVVFLFVGVGYGIFRQVYTLKGTANVIGHNWALDTTQDDVVSKLNGQLLTANDKGYAKVDTIDGNIEISYDVDLKELGDVYTVDFTISNQGTLDVILNNVNSVGFEQHSEYLTYQLIKVDRISDQTGEPLNSGIVLRKFEKLKGRIIVTYRNDAAKDITKFPSGGQTFVANLKTTFEFGEYVES